MGKIVVSGSTAYDFIMSYKGNFGDSIHPESIDNLSVSFLISELKKETGGTGLNIAFNLALLGEDAILLTSVGEDFVFDNFVEEKINLQYIKKTNKLLSASGYIMSDARSSQITAFYPGAMDIADETSVLDVREEVSYVIVSPNKKEAMMKHLREADSFSMLAFFDPGQQIFAFTKEELMEAFGYSTYLIANEYEYQEILLRTELSESELLNYFEKIIVTLGEKGVKILTPGESAHIEAVKVEDVVDTTGAGDAFRAGLLKGLTKGYDFETSAKMGAIVASYCVQFQGAQNHFVNKGLVEEGMLETYEMNITLN